MGEATGEREKNIRVNFPGFAVSANLIYEVYETGEGYHEERLQSADVDVDPVGDEDSLTDEEIRAATEIVTRNIH